MIRTFSPSALALRTHLKRTPFLKLAANFSSEGPAHLPNSQSPITPKLRFFNSITEEGKQIPTYRVLDGIGNLIEGAELPEVHRPT